MKLRHRIVVPVLLACLLGGTAVQAYTLEEFTFESPAKEAEFRDLIGKLRCLVCQNESLAGSQADLAQDLRKEVYKMMSEGKSKDEVLEFLIARYGDFVLYEPPIKPSTYLLWFGPFLLTALGGFLLVRTLRRKGAEPEQTISAAETDRLQQLLARAGDSKDKTK